MLFDTAAVAQFNPHPCARLRAHFLPAMIVQEEAVAGADAPSDPNTVAVDAVPSLEKVNKELYKVI